MVLRTVSSSCSPIPERTLISDIFELRDKIREKSYLTKQRSVEIYTPSHPQNARRQTGVSLFSANPRPGKAVVRNMSPGKAVIRNIWPGKAVIRNIWPGKAVVRKVPCAFRRMENSEKKEIVYVILEFPHLNLLKRGNIC